MQESKISKNHDSTTFFIVFQGFWSPRRALERPLEATWTAVGAHLESKMHLERTRSMPKRHKRRSRGVQEASKWCLVAPSGVQQASKRRSSAKSRAKETTKRLQFECKRRARRTRRALERYLRCKRAKPRKITTVLCFPWFFRG